ncbi:C-X-C chemokine receptor type 3-like isoform X2 [Sardina pilchardus]
MDIDVDFHMNSSVDDYVDYGSGVNCLPAREVVFIPALLYVALVLGLLGNGLVLAVLWFKRRSWSVTDTFVLNLAVADILLLATLPFWAVNAENGWTFGTGFCKAVAAIFKINIYFGMFALTCISSHHLLLVTDTYRVYSRQRLWMPHATCLAAWVVSILLSIGDWLSLKPSKDHAYLERHWCPVPVSQCRVGGVVFLLVTVALVLGYTVVLVRRPLKRPQEFKKGRAIRFTLALTAAFFLTWLPYNIALVVDPVGAGGDDCPDRQRTAVEVALFATAAIGCMQCFLKPLLYLGLASVFRTRVLELTRCITRCITSSSQSNHKISMWDSGGEDEEEEDDSPAKVSLSQCKC